MKYVYFRDVAYFITRTTVVTSCSGGRGDCMEKIDRFTVCHVSMDEIEQTGFV